MRIEGSKRTTIVLGRDETLVIQFEGADGEIEVAFPEGEAILVTADPSDDTGRDGAIYEHTFDGAKRKPRESLA